jgi:hypothetical protein
MPKTDKGVAWRLAIILTVALLLRVVYLSRESLWLDEIASWVFATRDLPGVLRSEPTNPPLYYALLHFWIGWFGTSEAALRSLSIPPSMLSVWLAYRLASRLFCPPVGYWAALYQAISSFHIYYAQEARCFAWLGCTILWATLYLWSALEAQTPQRRWLFYSAYTLFSTLALYLHFISVFFVAAQGLYVLVWRRREVIRTGLSIGVTVLLFAPWLRIMLLASGGRGQIRRHLLLKLPQTYFSFLFGDRLIPLDERAVQNIGATLTANWWILALALLGSAVLGAYCVGAWKRWGAPLVFVGTMATLPVLLAFVASLKVAFFDDRYLFPSAAFVYIVIAAAIWEITLRRREGGASRWAVTTGWAAGAAWLVLSLVSLFNYYVNPRFGREQWREVVAYIESSVTKEHPSVVVFDPEYIQVCFKYYQTRNPPIQNLTLGKAKELISVTLRNERLHETYPVWLIRSHSPSDDVLNALRARFRQVSVREFPKQNGIVVYSFDPGSRLRQTRP